MKNKNFELFETLMKTNLSPSDIITMMIDNMNDAEKLAAEYLMLEREEKLNKLLNEFTR